MLARVFLPPHLLPPPHLPKDPPSPSIKGKLTNHAQPHKPEPQHCQHRQSDPQRRLHVQRQPEKPTVGLIRSAAAAGARVRALKDPGRVAGGGVDLVPPAQADEAAASDVFEVVEVGGEEEDGEDEDEDARFWGVSFWWEDESLGGRCTSFGRRRGRQRGRLEGLLLGSKEGWEG